MSCKEFHKFWSGWGLKYLLSKGLFFFLFIFLTGTFLYAQSFIESRHGNPAVMPRRCASCHKGHGIKNSPMLLYDEENLCYQCHGSQSQRDKAQRENLISGGVNPVSVIEDFQKPYRHPVELKVKHRAGDVNSPEGIVERHSECSDCHDPHRVGGFKRFTGSGVMEKEWTAIGAVFQFELCYRCHSSIANLPLSQRDKRAEFNTSNASFHPVEGEGKNYNIPSLTTSAKTIKCTDCHGSDSGSDAPHGSIYENILKKNYTRSDGVESNEAYALCYSCHSRSSILANESFRFHRQHIVDNNTSCYTCHDSHGSINFPALIRFNKDPRFTRVNPGSSGRLEFYRLGNNKGGCYLNCHGVDHNPKEY